MEKNVLSVLLGINSGKREDFTFSLESNEYDLLKNVFQDESSKDELDKSTFWNFLKANNPVPAEVVQVAVKEELRDYIYENDLYDADFPQPDNCFPLADLHFDYLTTINNEKTMRHFDCSKCVIYDNYELDCDLSINFETE